MEISSLFNTTHSQTTTKIIFADAKKMENGLNKWDVKRKVG